MLSDERLQWWAERIYDAVEFNRYTVDLTELDLRGGSAGWDRDDPTLDTMRAMQTEILKETACRTTPPA